MRVKVKLLRRNGVRKNDRDVANEPWIEARMILSVRTAGGWSFPAFSLHDLDIVGPSGHIATLWEPRIMALASHGMRWMGFERSDRGTEGAAAVVQEWMVEPINNDPPSPTVIL